MDKFGNLLEKIQLLANGIAGRELTSEISRLQEKIKTERLYIVVLGLFKRGKSSLINALLGKDLLPVGVTPVTAIVTLLEFTTSAPFIEIQYKDGHRQQKAIEELSLYVSEEQNAANEKEVEVVRIYCDAPLLKIATLVDTPGLGSAFEHNTAATLQFIPKIDAAIVVLSADWPISKTEIDFLSELKSVVPRIIVVLNKIDLLPEDDLKKIVAHNEGILSGLLQGTSISPQLFLVSARQPHNRIVWLHRLIENMAVHEKGAIMQESISRQYNWLHKELQMQLQLKFDALTMPLTELEQRRSQLQASIQLMQMQKDEFASIINSRIRLMQDQIHITVNDASKTIKSRVNERLSEAINKDESVNHLHTELDQYILNEFDEIKRSMEQASREQFKSLLTQYSNRSQSFLNELAHHLTALMGISFDMIADKFDLDIYTSFYLTLSSDHVNGTYNKSLLYKLLPASIRKKQLLKGLQKHYNEVVIRNTSAIIYDLQYKIQESFRKFNYDLNNRFSELLQTIESIIEDAIRLKNQTERSLDAEIGRLRNNLVELEAIKLPAV
ncbi:hypothetical protein A3860_34465 [Niastella vici]|uniref:Dynamin-type G domain-containing protein n=1 Tax=Niastella vici TaxID=1703345 RepID=A0A1V9FPA0_9BACT|nr:dynamin family protein [Niastella vici]OQP60185.1 hypothetical protein A3860_34465 [Niastella vici]